MVQSNPQDQTNKFFDMQKQYFDALAKQSGDFMNSDGNPAMGMFQNQWQKLFQEWQKIILADTENPLGNAPGSNLFPEHFAKSGKDFMNMLQTFCQTTGQAKSVDQMTKEWLVQMQGFLSSSINNNNNNPMDAFDPMYFIASMPTLGADREQQEQLNNLYKKYTKYKHKSKIFDHGMSKIAMEGLYKFQEYIMDPPEEDDELETLKDVYDKWVDVNEEVYAGYANSEEYMEAYGELVNALMDLKQEINSLIDGFMEKLNLPTRKEMDSNHKRVHELRRDNIQLKKDVTELKKAIGTKPRKVETKTPAKKGAK